MAGSGGTPEERAPPRQRRTGPRRPRVAATLASPPFAGEGARLPNPPGIADNYTRWQGTILLIRRLPEDFYCTLAYVYWAKIE